MQLVRRMMRRGVVAAAALAAATVLAAGTGTALAETAGAGSVPANVDAGAITMSRPAADQSQPPAQVCGEGVMRIDRSGAQRVEHTDCSATDVMGVTVARSAADGAAPAFGERAVPATVTSSAAADYPVVNPPAVLGTTVARTPVAVEPVAPLPVTGGDVMPLVLGGLGALAVGAAGVVMARRRQPAPVAV